jgi:hypothetical protein
MPLDIVDFFEQVEGFSIEDAPPEVRARINDALADLTSDITDGQGNPSEGESPTDPNVVVVDKDGGGDFTTIQAAVDDPDTEPGDTVLIRPGEYVTDGELSVTDPGELRLVGSGSGSDPSSNTVLRGQLEVLVEEAAGNGVTVRDLRIEGVSDDGAAINGTASFGGTALREIGVENVAFVDNLNEGLDIQDPAENLAVRDCLIEDNGDNGIEGADITNAVVSDCTITNNDGEGIDFDQVQSLIIDGCTLTNNDSGIEFDSDASNLTITDTALRQNDDKGIEFDGDGVDNNGEQGVVTNRLIDPSSAIANAEFRDTTIRANGFEGVGLFANNISTLVFENLSVVNNGLEGIDLFGRDIGDIAISNVTADDNGGIGIALGDAFDETVSTVSTVDVRDASASGNVSEGVLVATERISELRFSNLSASTNGFEGIDLFGDDIGEIDIGNVTADDNGGIGIALGGTFDERVSTVSTVGIRDTSASGNAFEGILVSTEQISDLTLANLSVSNNELEGFDLFGNALSDVTLSQVTARDNGGFGVFVGNSTDDADIGNFTVEMSVVAANGTDFGYSGVLVAGNSTDASIVESNVVDNAAAGVRKRNGTGTVGVENSFLDGNGGSSTDGNVTTSGLRSSPVSEAGVDDI